MFAKFFPTAPSVLQQKKSRSKTSPEKKQVPSAALAVTPGAEPAPELTAHSSTRDAVGGEEGFAATVNGDATSTGVNLNIPDESEHAQGDLLNGVGSASSTSTASSVFSAINQQPSMATYGTAHSFLTPLTTTDSSPSGKAVSPPPVNMFRANSPPEVTSRRSEGQVELGPISPTRMAPLGASHSSRTHARAPGKESKGCKAVYDPELDKKLSSKERRSRKVQYKDFGQEVSSYSYPPSLILAMQIWTTFVICSPSVKI